MTLDYTKLFQDENPYNEDLEQLQVLSTIRYDPSLSKQPPPSPHDITKENFFLLQEHVERLSFTLDFFTSLLHQKNHTHQEFPFEVSLDFIFHQLVDAIKSAGITTANPLKVRLLMGLNGNAQIELHEVPAKACLLDGLENSPPPEDRYDLYVDRSPVLISPFTSFKTTNRAVYNQARAKLPGLRPGKEEVILINSTGEVMEGSITNIAIKDAQGTWITPKLTSGCLCGVTRHLLLKRKAISETTITKDMLVLDQDVLLLNGIGGAQRGTIKGFL